MMKFILLMGLLGTVQLGLAQNIWVANNNADASEGSHVFSSLQDAIDAATAGDIIHVIPSGTTYGDVVVDKQLTFKGIGYNPNTTFNYTSHVNSMDLNTAAASGTVIRGLNIVLTNLASGTGPVYTLSDIVIEFSRFGRIVQNTTTNNIDGLRISNCVSHTANTYIITLATDTKLQNCVIANNIMENTFWIRPDLPLINAGNYTQIKNNLFIGAGEGSGNYTFGSVVNCIISNNVFYGKPVRGRDYFEKNTFSYNLTFNVNDAYQDFPPDPVGGEANLDGGGNIIETDPGYTALAFYAWSFTNNDLTPVDGAAIINAGSDGTDIGPTGGQFPFTVDLEGKIFGTNIPTIQEVVVPGLINQGQVLPISISAKSNN